MRQSIKFMALTLCYLIFASSLTYAVDVNGAWQLLQNGAVSLSVPSTWNLESGFPSAADTEGTSTLSLSVTLLTSQETPQSAAEQIIFTKSGLLENAPIQLPAGAGWYLHAQDMINGQPVFTVQYFVGFENILVTVTGITPENDHTASIKALFQRAVHTLKIDDTRNLAWSSYTDTTGMLSLRTPPDWLYKPAGDKVLTVIQPESQQIITLNYRPLSDIPTLEEAAQMLLDVYTEQNIPAVSLEPVSLPVGETYRALIMNIPVQIDAQTTFESQQYQYILLRGDALIFINAGCETSVFEQCRPLLEQIIDTIVFNAA